MESINIKDKFSLFKDYWSPKIIADLNDSQVKIAKIKGEFVWHTHEEEDELFLLIKGNFVIKLRDKDIKLKEGELVVIPKGIEHKPVAEEEAHILLIELKGTINTGEVTDGKTKIEEEYI
ncbi:MAG: cupin domain-containing protein [Candidatus Hodarchaeales archaeon]